MSADVLSAQREIINETDREMARLFEKRMDAVREIARWKKEHGLPVLDAAREKAVIARNAALIRSDELRGDYVRFIGRVMECSRDYQRRLISGIRAAFSGVEGAFAHIAAITPASDALRPRNAASRNALPHGMNLYPAVTAENTTTLGRNTPAAATNAPATPATFRPT